MRCNYCNLLLNNCKYNLFMSRVVLEIERISTRDRVKARERERERERERVPLELVQCVERKERDRERNHERER